jgi:hypothetical protein
VGIISLPSGTNSPPIAYFLQTHIWLSYFPSQNGPLNA